MNMIISIIHVQAGPRECFTLWEQEQQKTIAFSHRLIWSYSQSNTVAL